MDRRLIPLGVVCICGGWLQTGCIIPEPPDLENAPGISVLGGCMCSECWTQPFCVTDEDPSIVFDDDGNVVVPDSSGSCPAGSSPSPRASRVAADMNQRDDAEFYCIQPRDRDVDPAGVKCPSLDEDELEAAGFVSWDECQDTAISCRGPICENGPRDGEPSCDIKVERGAIKSACKNRTMGDTFESLENAYLAAGAKLREDKCAVHGFDLPASDFPIRYCYLNCINPTDPDLRVTTTCNEAFFDPPETPLTSLRFNVDEQTSDATVIVSADGESDTGTFDVTGELSLYVPARCVPPFDEPGARECEGARLGLLRLNSLNNQDVFGSSASDLFLINEEPVGGEANTLDTGSGFFFSDPGAQLYLSGHVADLGRKEFRFITDEEDALFLAIDWNARDVDLIATFDGSAGSVNSTVVLNVHATFSNLPPIADAGDDQNVVCSGNDSTPRYADLSALGSTDPDGDNGISFYRWAREGELIGYAPEVSAPLHVGTNIFTLSVSDRYGAISSDAVVVEVVPQRVPLLISGGSKAQRCGDGASYEIATATDSCGATLDVDGLVTLVDGFELPTPSPIVDHVATLAGSTTEVVWTAIDRVGNLVSTQQTIDLVNRPALFAIDKLKLADRARVTTSSGYGAIYSGGAAGVELGVDAKVGSVWSAANVIANNGSTINGEVAAGGNLFLGNNAKVTGQVTLGQVPAFPEFPELRRAFPTATKPVTVSNNSKLTLTPGSYRAVAVFSGSTLQLSAGDYYFESLQLEPQAVLKVVKTAGPVRVFVEQNLIYRGRLVQVPLGPSGFSLGLKTKNDAFFESVFQGRLVAPNAHVVLGAGNALQFLGEFAARSLELRPGVQVLASPTICD